MQYLTRVTPTYLPPKHLAPLVEELEAIKRGEERYVVCSTPPRGGKTQTLLHGLTWILQDRPEWELGYLAYNATQARKMSRKGLVIAERARLKLSSHAVTDWRTSEGGGLAVRGVGEGLTGQGLDVTVVDDPHKDRADAESGAKRERVWDWFNDVVFTRRNPTTSRAKRPQSIIVNAARWHTDDLMGRLIKQGWRYINIPALTGEGEQVKSFWPEGWTVEALRKTQEQLGPYSWASLYQGQPRPRGGAVFGDPWTWSELPASHRAGLGLDLAYTAKTSADWSVVVTLLLAPDGLCYVVDVQRVQMRAPDFIKLVRRHRKQYPHARARWYVSSTEKGLAEVINPELTWLEAPLASDRGDKFVRAQPVAAAWNAGKVLVPEDSEAFPWVSGFVSELVNFTGLGDKRDDQVDALAAGYDALVTPVGLTPVDAYGVVPAVTTPRVGSPEWREWSLKHQQVQLDEALERGMQRKREERMERENPFGDDDGWPTE